MVPETRFRVSIWVASSLLLWRVSASSAEPNHDFAKWEPEIRAFEERDRTNPPPRGGVLFIGSSMVRLWTNLAREFPRHQVLNRGFGGSEIADATHFADRILFPYEPRTVFLRAGGNDIHAGRTPEQVFNDFKEFATSVRAKLPKAEIVYISGFPSIERWSQAEKEHVLNDMISAYVRQTPGLKYVDAWDLPLGADDKPRPELFADKLHLNAEGYKMLADRVRPFLPGPGQAN
jgi:lysophospholipase L1-like esterase